MKKPRRTDLNWRERLMLGAGGAFVAFYGYGQILRAKPIYSNWMQENIPAQFTIFLGLLGILAAIIPWGRLHFLWNDAKQKRRL